MSERLESETKRPPRQPRTGLTSTGARKAGSKQPRSRSREFALQGLYQHLVGRNDLASIDAFTRDLTGFHKADAVHFDGLLHGCIEQAEALDALILPLLDRKPTLLSPVEHAVLWIGAYEMRHCLDVPWRVVLNECIELAKEFGGTDGHKYVNGVLNGLAPRLRAAEVERDKGRRPAEPAREAWPAASPEQLEAPRDLSPAPSSGPLAEPSQVPSQEPPRQRSQDTTPESPSNISSERSREP